MAEIAEREFDTRLRYVAGLKLPVDDVAFILDITPGQLRQYLSLHYQATYEDFSAKCTAPVKQNLISAAFSLVFDVDGKPLPNPCRKTLFKLLEVFCGWNDKMDHSVQAPGIGGILAGWTQEQKERFAMTGQTKAPVNQEPEAESSPLDKLQVATTRKPHSDV